jgi:hypothetical protein
LGPIDLVPFFNTGVTLAFADTLFAILLSWADCNFEVHIATVFNRLDSSAPSRDSEERKIWCIERGVSAIFRGGGYDA